MSSKVTIDDFRVIVRMMKANFTWESFIPDEYSFMWWYGKLQDIPFPLLNKAVNNYCSTNSNTPTPYDIRSYAYTFAHGAEELSSQAWNQLLMALRDAYAPDSKKVWENLPEITKNVVGGYATFRAWGNTELSALESVQRPMFIKRYEELQSRTRKEAALPSSIRKPLPSLMTAEQKTIDYRPETPDKAPAKPSGRSRADDLAELKKRLMSK